MATVNLRDILLSGSSQAGSLFAFWCVTARDRVRGAPRDGYPLGLLHKLVLQNTVNI
jgi:hypothetical protein